MILTKENFWAAIEAESPRAYTSFISWYHAYKQKHGAEFIVPFSQQPLAHQLGLLMLFFLEQQEVQPELTAMIGVLRGNFDLLNEYLEKNEKAS